MKIFVHERNNLIFSGEFDGQPVTVGSHASASIHLPDMRVAEHQCLFLPGECGTWSIESMEGGVRMSLNGHNLTKRTPINDGDELHIFEYILKVAFHGDTGTGDGGSVVSDEARRMRLHALPASAVTRKSKDDVTLSNDARKSSLEFAFSIRDRVDVNSLMEFTIATLFDDFNANSVWMGARRRNYGGLEYTDGCVSGGGKMEQPPLYELLAYRCMENRQFLLMPEPPLEGLGSVLAVPLVSEHGELGLLYLDRVRSAPPFDERDLDRLMVLSFLVAGQFEAIIHDHAKLRQVMADGEQAVVRAVQSRLDPNVVPEWDNLQLAVYCKGGSERVTDLYDVMRLPTGQACLLVARIESEGVQTALSMAGVRAAFRVAGLHCDPPHILLKELDWLMRSEQSTSKIACATACVNTKTGEVQYASAGTAGLYRVDGRGEPHQLADPDLPMVGSGKDSAYTTKTTELQSDESLAMFTPGFLTLSKGEDEPTLTEDQFVDTLCDGFGQSAQELIDEAVKELSPYLKKGHQPDDITLLAAHWMSATL